MADKPKKPDQSILKKPDTSTNDDEGAAALIPNPDENLEKESSQTLDEDDAVQQPLIPDDDSERQTANSEDSLEKHSSRSQSPKSVQFEKAPPPTRPVKKSESQKTQRSLISRWLPKRPEERRKSVQDQTSPFKSLTKKRNASSSGSSSFQSQDSHLTKENVQSGGVGSDTTAPSLGSTSFRSQDSQPIKDEAHIGSAMSSGSGSGSTSTQDNIPVKVLIDVGPQNKDQSSIMPISPTASSKEESEESIFGALDFGDNRGSSGQAGSSKDPGIAALLAQQLPSIAETSENPNPLENLSGRGRELNRPQPDPRRIAPSSPGSSITMRGERKKWIAVAIIILIFAVTVFLCIKYGLPDGRNEASNTSNDPVVNDPVINDPDINDPVFNPLMEDFNRTDTNTTDADPCINYWNRNVTANETTNATVNATANATTNVTGQPLYNMTNDDLAIRCANLTTTTELPPVNVTSTPDLSEPSASLNEEN